MFPPYCVLESYLPLLEGLSGQISPAGSLEQRDVPPGLNVTLLLQLGKSPRSEEDLQVEKKGCSQSHTHLFSFK